jgi:hypothetical protein
VTPEEASAFVVQVSTGSSAEPQRTTTSNCAFITAETLLDAELLVCGAAPPNALSLLNLSAVAQAAVLHESAIPTVNLELNLGTPLIDALSASNFLQRGDTTFINWEHKRQQGLKSFTLVYPDPGRPGTTGYRLGVREALTHLIETDAAGLCRRLADRNMQGFPPDLSHVSEAVFAWADFAREHSLQLVGDVLWSPLLYTQLVRTSVPKALYDRLAHQFDLNADLAFRNLGLRRLPVPPIGAVLLDRCTRPADIPKAIVHLREEFAPLREALSQLEDKLSQAGTLQEKLEIQRDVDAEWDRVARKIMPSRRRAWWWLWSAIEFGVRLILAPPSALQQALTDALSQAKDNPPRIRLQGFLDIYAQATDTRYHELAQRVFRTAVPEWDLRGYARFCKATAAMLQIGQSEA